MNEMAIQSNTNCCGWVLEDTTSVGDRCGPEVVFEIEELTPIECANRVIELIREATGLLYLLAAGVEQ